MTASRTTVERHFVMVLRSTASILRPQPDPKVAGTPLHGSTTYLSSGSIRFTVRVSRGTKNFRLPAP